MHVCTKTKTVCVLHASVRIARTLCVGDVFAQGGKKRVCMHVAFLVLHMLKQTRAYGACAYMRVLTYAHALCVDDVHAETIAHEYMRMHTCIHAYAYMHTCVCIHAYMRMRKLGTSV